MAEEDILKKLNQIAKLLAVIVTKEEETQREKVLKLDELGFEPYEIAEILGMERQTVYVIRSKEKSKRVKKK